jgi:hypothetical protein
MQSKRSSLEGVEPVEATVVLNVLLRRARRQLATDVRRGVLTDRQAHRLFQATVRRYTKRLGVPLPVSA